LMRLFILGSLPNFISGSSYAFQLLLNMSYFVWISFLIYPDFYSLFMFTNHDFCYWVS
jgi:hypothetical protein